MFGGKLVGNGLPCHPVIKVLGVSSIAGGMVWIGRIFISLNFQDGFIFSTLSLVAIKIAYLADPFIQPKFKAPIIVSGSFLAISFGIPVVIMSQIKTLNLTMAIYLSIVAILARRFS